MKNLMVVLGVLTLVGCAKSEVPVQCKGYATFIPVPNNENVPPRIASIELDRLRHNANGSWDFHRINGKGMTSQAAWMKPDEFELIECVSGPVEQLRQLKTRTGDSPEIL
ncbi:hypothetical protein [Enterobacter sp.]|uniref:hypothetical protein n=1 Tax=Enterobacter sp. TaxID=42895 RepID=UPI00296E856F|nr:hypothetical protein [Enterobacter sp.]